MRGSDVSPRRFGIFELDLKTGELRKAGVLVHLPPQPFKILALLASRPGQLLTREEIQQHVWGGETFVDFEQGLNFAIKRIRDALGDDAETPRYVETLPRRGYRFIYPVDVQAIHELPLLTTGPRAIRESPLRKHGIVAASGGALVAIVAVLLAFNVAGLRDRLGGMVGAGSARPREGTALPYPRIQSIAVLPLENLSGDKEQEYFADGMTEALITDLGKISALRVISRTSVMRYKQTKKPLPEVARELNVDAVVEGSVMRSGGRVRITANLLHAPTDRHLWSASYERDLEDSLALQSAVAREIARQIQVKVTPREQSRLASRRAVNPEAYQDYLMGVYHGWKTTPDGHRLAIEYFQKAIGKDPEFALGYAGLAFVYLYQRRRPASERGPAARAAAMKALELDPNLGEAHRAWAQVKYQIDWGWKEAEEEFKRAIELSPNDANAHHEYSHFLTAMGRPEESLRESKLAVEIDPLAAGMVMHMGWHYSQVRQYDLAIAEYERALSLDTNLYEAHFQAGKAYEVKGRFEEAAAHYLKAKTLEGASPQEVEALRQAFQTSGMKGYWRKQLEMEERRLAEGEAVDLGGMALIHEIVGNRGAALDWLEKACNERPLDLTWLMLDPRLAKLLPEPRIKTLLRRMNFPP